MVGEVLGCRRPSLQSMVAVHVTTGTLKAESLDVMISCFPAVSETTQDGFDFDDLPLLNWAQEDRHICDAVTNPGSGARRPQRPASRSNCGNRREKWTLLSLRFHTSKTGVEPPPSGFGGMLLGAGMPGKQDTQPWVSPLLQLL